MGFVQSRVRLILYVACIVPNFHSIPGYRKSQKQVETKYSLYKLVTNITTKKGGPVTIRNLQPYSQPENDFRLLTWLVRNCIHKLYLAVDRESLLGKSVQSSRYL